METLAGAEVVQAYSVPLPNNKLFHDLTGLIHNRWTVLSYCGHTKGRNALWLCRCICGTEKVVIGGNVVSGDSQSCGCLPKEQRVFEPLAVRKKKYYETHHPKRRNLYYLKKYGVTLAQAEALLVAQAGKCAVCQTPIQLGGKAGAKVDHCHKTGRVRGVLCHFCNLALGHLRDDVVRLAAAIAYLKASTPPATANYEIGVGA